MYCCIAVKRGKKMKKEKENDHLNWPPVNMSQRR